MIDLSDLHAIDRSKYHLPGVRSSYNITVVGIGATISDAVDRLYCILENNPLVDRGSIIFVFNAQSGSFLSFCFVDGDIPAEHDDKNLWEAIK